nr:M15 family metallopeptidase [Serratia ficaria]
MISIRRSTIPATSQRHIRISLWHHSEMKCYSLVCYRPIGQAQWAEALLGTRGWSWGGDWKMLSDGFHFQLKR